MTAQVGQRSDGSKKETISVKHSSGRHGLVSKSAVEKAEKDVVLHAVKPSKDPSAPKLNRLLLPLSSTSLFSPSAE